MTLSPIEMDKKIREAFNHDADNGVADDRVYAKALYWAAQIEAYFEENDLFEMGLNEDDEDKYYEIECSARNFLSKFFEDLSRDCAGVSNQPEPPKEKKTQPAGDDLDSIIAEMAESIINEELYGDWEVFCRNEILSVLPIKAEEEKIRGMDETTGRIFEKKNFKYPFDTLEIIFAIVSYVKDDVSVMDAEKVVSTFLKNCSVRLKQAPAEISFIYCVAIKYCTENLSRDFTIGLYESNKALLKQCKTEIDYSDVLSMCAPLYIESDADKALEMLTEAYDIRVRLFPEKAKIVGITLCQISSAYQLKREHQKAIEVAMMAYNAFPEEEQTIQLGHALVYLVHSLYDTERHEESPKWLDIVAGIYQKNQDQPGALDLFLEFSLASGNYYMVANQPVIAEKHYRDGIAMGEKLDPSNETLERLKLNLSVLLGKIVGDTQTASDILSEYTSPDEFIPSGNHALSLMYRSIATLAESGAELEQAARRSLDEISADPTKPSYMQKFIYIRALLVNQKHRSHKKEIIHLLRESEDEITRLGLRESELMIDILTNKAIFSFLLYDYEDAERYAQEALRLSGDSYLLHELYMLCGQLQLAMGKGEKALSCYNDALMTALARLNTAKKYLNESRVRDYLHIIRVITNFYFSLTTQGKTSASHEDQYDTVLMTKALPSLIEVVKKDTAVITPQQKQLLDQINIIKEQAPPDVEQQIYKLEMEYAAADTAVMKLPEIRCADVQKKMPPRSAIIEFFEYYQIEHDVFHSKLEERAKYIWYAVFLTVKDADGNLEFGRVRDVDSLFVSIAAKELRHAIERKDEKQIIKLRKKLYNLIIKDIRPYLAGCEHLYIAPDSDLATLPFEILGSKNYLMDDFKISYLETGRDINSNSGFVDMKGVSVVIGNPQYEIERSETIERPNIRTLYRGGESADNIYQLPLSNLEAQVVARRLGTMPLLGEQATKYAVLNSANPKVLHIATHGHVNDLDIEDERIPVNPMAQSCLMMAGAVSERKKEKYNPKFANGILTATEVAQKNLSSTDLVVLSACVTGLGKKVYSEVVGMKVAFKVAGAKNTIVSLWHVDDFATAVFMDIFYAYLNDHDVHTALWRTKQTLRTVTVGMLKQNGWLKEDAIKQMGASAEIARSLLKESENHTPFSDEGYWAGFVCQQN